MIVVDANLLVFAYDTTALRHREARRWWEAALSAPEPIGIPWVVVLAFTRLLTHPTICERPVTTAVVRDIVESWVALPHVRLLSPTQETVRTFFSLLENAGVGGNLSTDALIAAHAIEHGGVVHSNDRDFGRFAGLRWRNPLEGKPKQKDRHDGGLFGGGPVPRPSARSDERPVLSGIHSSEGADDQQPHSKPRECRLP